MVKIFTSGGGELPQEELQKLEGRQVERGKKRKGVGSF